MMVNLFVSCDETEHKGKGRAATAAGCYEKMVIIQRYRIRDLSGRTFCIERISDTLNVGCVVKKLMIILLIIRIILVMIYVQIFVKQVVM